MRHITRMFLAALRTYGAYLVDSAGGFSFSAEDIHTAAPRHPSTSAPLHRGRPSTHD